MYHYIYIPMPYATVCKLYLPTSAMFRPTYVRKMKDRFAAVCAVGNYTAKSVLVSCWD